MEKIWDKRELFFYFFEEYLELYFPITKEIRSLSGGTELAYSLQKYGQT